MSEIAQAKLTTLITAAFQHWKYFCYLRLKKKNMALFRPILLLFIPIFVLAHLAFKLQEYKVNSFWNERWTCFLSYSLLFWLANQCLIFGATNVFKKIKLPGGHTVGCEVTFLT